MDLDAFVAAHQKTWQELDKLSKSVSLSAAEAERLVKLYQQTATHLSTLRSQAPDPAIVTSLSTILARSRRKVGSSSESLLASVKRFFLVAFPVELYRLRWWWLGTMAVSYLFALVVAVWIYVNPDLHGVIASPEQIQRLVNHDFEAYYHEYANSHFAASVWVNNAWVSAQAIAMGVTGIAVVYVLYQNNLNLAVNGALMAYYGKGLLFWALILPHGLLELTAVYVAGGTGLFLFWSWVNPEPMTARESFGQAGRRAMVVALGLIPTLAVAGLLEGFVTPSALPNVVRIGLGVLALVLFLLYALVLGRKQYLAGADADVAEWQRAETVAAAQ